MTISTKGRYGLRLLIDIALHQQNGVVKLKDIAKRQDVSVKYLWQVANPLKGAGLLRATRGASGGFLLAKETADITLLEVVSALEGPLALVGCVQHNDCGVADTCAAHAVWCRLSQTLGQAMQGVTLHEVVQLQEQLGQVGPCSI